jgi:EAL domain-containing protein (putative c-di-GMP-specific phosphodiesterase class I)
LNPYSARRLTLMGDLRDALNAEQLELYFQPKINIRTGSVVGAEALLRWHHPMHGFVTPDQFVPLAEQTGLIKPLTRWVIERAVKEMADWHRQGIQIGVSINISARNLREVNFGEQIQDLLQRYGVSPNWLTLEVTETAMMEDRDAALRVLTAIHRSGIRISVDDFGVGYSSLAYLSQLPISELKIDKGFIFDMDRKGGEDVIVRTTINMAHDLRAAGGGRRGGK